MGEEKNLYNLRLFLYSEMSKKNNLDEIIDIFLSNIGLFNNIDVIIVNSGDSNNLSQPLKLNFNFNKGRIYSNFESDELYILNQEVVMLASFQKNYTFGTLFDISVDTQIVSYIDRYIRGIDNSKDIDDIVLEITKKRKYASSMNLTPYILENCLKSGSVSKEVTRNVFNFFKVLNCNHSKINALPVISAFIKTKLIVHSFKKMHKSKATEIFYYRFKIIYIMLMEMYLISIKSTIYKKKVIECLDFCNDELNRMPMAELILAFEFFKKGTNIRFFGKFQKNYKGILKAINNSAWDIFHLRILDIYMPTVRNKRARLTLPFFFSIDQRLNEVAELIKLKMIIVNHDTKTTNAFYSNQIVMNTINAYSLQEYFKFETGMKRLQKSPDLDELIFRLQNQINSMS